MIKVDQQQVKEVLMKAKTFFGSGALVLCVASGVIGISAYGVRASLNQPAAVQDVLSLDRRISFIEQRFYAMESRLNRLEQQAAASPRAPSPATTTRDSDINFLTGEIEQLRRRLAEVECGVVRLDERTKPMRDQAGKGQSGDPCRLNSGEPVRLSGRP